MIGAERILTCTGGATNMNWDAIGAGAELLGAIATVATLAYLALQIRQSNKIARVSAASVRAEQHRQLGAFLSQSPEINRVFWAGLESPESLSQADYHYFEAIVSTVLSSYESAFYLQNEDALFQREWDGQLQGLKWLVTSPSFERWWSTWRNMYGIDFVTFVDSLVVETNIGRS
jgi:hypothetical protein